ncbi:MAG: hypothetical protein QNK03_11205 [Myxococcota bacterium]|nr:hypothetical protein [Myxococcota bacterium]
MVQTLALEDADGVSRLNEPTGIVFASPSRAFVTLDDPNQVVVLDVAPDGTASVSATRLAVGAQGPRALAVAGGRLFVAAFESNNQTEFPTCVQFLGLDPRPLDESDPFDEGCEFDLVVDGNRFIFDPNLGGRIIVDGDQPDRDLFVYDAGTLELLETVEGVSTLIYGISANADASRVSLTSADARNELDGLLALENRMFDNLLSVLDCDPDCASGSITRVDLDVAAGQPVPTPYGIAESASGNARVITASGSDGAADRPGLFVVDAAGAVRGSVATGAIPQGVALRSAPSGDADAAYVLNTVDGTVSVVSLADLDAPVVQATLEVGSDPTPPAVRRGRIAFASASASTTGTFSCESCHPGGHTDQLQWVINTAEGPNDPLPPSGEKPEPRTTMPVRGLRGTLPLHWDGTLGDPLPGAFVPGDSAPDCDPAAPGGEHACFRHLVDASLSGVMCDPPCADGGALDESERDDMASFLMAVSYPPSPRRRADDALSPAALQGMRDFFTNDDGAGTAANLSCGSAGGGCHALPLGVASNSGFVGGFDAPTIRGMWDRFLLFSNGMFQAEEAMEFLDGLNLAHDTWDPDGVGHSERGSFLAVFPDSPFALDPNVNAGFIAIYGVRGEDMWEFLNEMSVGLPGMLGRQLTVTAASAGDAATAAAMDAFEAAADAGKISAAARSADLGAHRYAPGTGLWVAGGEARTGAELRALVTGDVALTLRAELPGGVVAGGDEPRLWGTIPRPSAGASATLLLQSAGVDPAARVLVDGAPCAGCTLERRDPGDPSRLVVTLDAAPAPGPHTLQVLNPRGLASNEMPLVSR